MSSGKKGQSGTGKAPKMLKHKPANLCRVCFAKAGGCESPVSGVCRITVIARSTPKADDEAISVFQMCHPDGYRDIAVGIHFYADLNLSIESLNFFISSSYSNSGLLLFVSSLTFSSKVFLSSFT